MEALSAWASQRGQDAALLCCFDTSAIAVSSKALAMLMTALTDLYRRQGPASSGTVEHYALEAPFRSLVPCEPKVLPSYRNAVANVVTWLGDLGHEAPGFQYSRPAVLQSHPDPQKAGEGRGARRTLPSPFLKAGDAPPTAQHLEGKKARHAPRASGPYCSVGISYHVAPSALGARTGWVPRPSAGKDELAPVAIPCKRSAAGLVANPCRVGWVLPKQGVVGQEKRKGQRSCCRGAARSHARRVRSYPHTRSPMITTGTTTSIATRLTSPPLERAVTYPYTPVLNEVQIVVLGCWGTSASPPNSNVRNMRTGNTGTSALEAMGEGPEATPPGKEPSNLETARGRSHSA
jgi:hypothetical protein